MRFITDATLVHRPDRLVEVDADAPQLLVHTPQGVGLGWPDGERKARLFAKQQPDDVAGGAPFLAQRGERIALFWLQSDPQHLAPHRFLPACQVAGGDPERQRREPLPCLRRGDVEFVPQT